MKKILVIGLIGLSISAGAVYYYYGGKCTGKSNCAACKNCKYCKYCAENGGSCGVCK